MPRRKKIEEPAVEQAPVETAGVTFTVAEDDEPQAVEIDMAPFGDMPNVLLNQGAVVGREVNDFTWYFSDKGSTPEKIEATIRDTFDACAEGKTLVLINKPTITPATKGSKNLFRFSYYLLQEAAESTQPKPYLGYEE